VTTGRHEIAERIELLRNCGSRVKYNHEEIGLNSRLDTVQAAILRAKLHRLDGWNAARKRIAARYDAALSSLSGVDCTRHANGSVYHLYVVKLAERDAVLKALNAQGIGAGIHYPFALHELKAYASLGYRPGAFPVAEEWARQCLSLPIYPELAPSEADACVAALESAIANGGGH
jgi:dTDP-4-amino-4,6-dideoxygalactose transaminase